VESSYGPVCSATKTDGCFVEKVDDTRIYLTYPKDGLAVFFKADAKTVFSFVYLPVVADHPADIASTAGGTSTGPASTEGGEPHADTENAIVSADTPATTSSNAANDQAALNDDPLKIGAMVYMRGDVSFLNHSLKVDQVSAPSLIDAYFDGRPTDRLRTMVLARLTYDPALNPTGIPSPWGLPPALLGSNPNVQLDQLWLNFDVQRVAFITVGRQHVKWGTGRLWSPTDFLTPIRTDPLAVFDTRLGTDMLKVNVPWEATNSNFYAIGLLDTRGPAPSPLEVGLALRAETVVFGAEVGLDAVFQQNQLPKYGASFTSALGPIDVHAEAAMRKEMPYTLWKPVASPDPAQGYGGEFAVYRPDHPFAQVSGGLNWKYVINEQRSLTLGTEGFYNQVGYDNAAVLPWLQITNSLQRFYAGKYYASAFASYDVTGLLNSTTFMLTGISNLSDHTGVARLDVLMQVMTALNLEFFASAPFGPTGGEFRFGMSSGPLAIGNGQFTPPIDITPDALELGVGFRLKI
jgi:hypothetical protein